MSDDHWNDDFYWRHYHSGGDGEGGGNFTGGSPGGVFKGVVIIIVVIVGLALLLGVGIPGAVWGFFGKLILFFGFFTLLDKIFK